MKDEKLSWKFLLPAGLIIWIIGKIGLVSVVGFILIALGIIDFARVMLFDKRKSGDGK